MLSSAVSPARGRQRTNADVRYSQEASACVQRRLAGGDSIAAAVIRRSNECPVRCGRVKELACHRLLNAGNGRRTWSCNSVLPRPSSPLSSLDVNCLSVSRSAALGHGPPLFPISLHFAPQRPLCSLRWLVKGAALPLPSRSFSGAQCVTARGKREIKESPCKCKRCCTARDLVLRRHDCLDALPACAACWQVSGCQK